MNEKRAVRLFLAYLKQRATQDALMALASSKGRREETANYLHTVTVLVGKTDTYLQDLVAVAPAFGALVALSYGLGPEVLPVSATPSQICVTAVMREYHTWVKKQR